MQFKSIGRRLASHPKLIHVLFVTLLVLTQVGIVVADDGGNGAYYGP